MSRQYEVSLKLDGVTEALAEELMCDHFHAEIDVGWPHGEDVPSHRYGLHDKMSRAYTFGGLLGLGGGMSTDDWVRMMAEKLPPGVTLTVVFCQRGAGGETYAAPGGAP